MTRREYQKYAFTLAEVLITLGIIGVLAAMTIPTLLHNIQEHELTTSFKKMYSVLNQAYAMTVVENGSVPHQCYYSSMNAQIMSECTAFWASFKQQLKVIKTYNGAIDGVNAPDYMGTELVSANGGHNSNPFCVSLPTYGTTAGKANKEVWTLSDGSMIISTDNVFSKQLLIIDTNGLKGPNKWGYDIFYLDFKNYASDGYRVKIEDDICKVYEKGGRTLSQIMIGE